MPPGSVVQVVTNRYAGRPAFTFYPGSDTPIGYLNTVITPKLASSLLICQFVISGECTYNTVYRSFRDGSLITNSGYWGYNNEDGSAYSGIAIAPYDTDLASTPFTQHVTYFVPAYNTNATTMQIAVRCTDGGTPVYYLNRTYNSGGANAYEIGVSYVTIWEIAQ
jgi:hypothetical protein